MFKPGVVWMTSQSSCYTGNADFWCLFSLAKKPHSQLYAADERLNFRADWSGHYKIHLWKHPWQYELLSNAFLGSLWLAYEKLQIPPKGIFGQILGEHLENQESDHLNETLQSHNLPLQKGGSAQNNSYCLSLGYLNIQLIEIICQAALQTTQWNIPTLTETHENLDCVFASIITFQIAQERKGEVMQCIPNDQGNLSGKANTEIWNHHTWLLNSTVSTR